MRCWVVNYNHLQPPDYTPTTGVEKESADTMKPTMSKPTMAGWDRVESVQDPGVGH